MYGWLFLVTLAAPADPVAVLLREAEVAAARGDEARRDRCLLGWASLQPRARPPTGPLEAAAARALAQIQSQGGLDVYTSRLADRLRLGVHDPAGLVDRVDASVEVEGRRVRLSRMEGGALDRRDYRLPEARHPLVIELWSTQFGPELLLRQTVIAAGAPSLPGPPDPKRAAQVIDPGPEVVPIQAQAPTPLISWWWVAGGVLAAGLAGAAIWQETR